MRKYAKNATIYAEDPRCRARAGAPSFARELFTEKYTFFGIAKKNRSEIMSATAKLENYNLCSRYDSSRIFFLYLSTFLEGDDDDDGDGRILGQGQARYSNAPRD